MGVTRRDLGGFVEAIAPTAFIETLRTADLISSFSHDMTNSSAGPHPGTSKPGVTMSAPVTGLFCVTTEPP